MVEAMNVDDYSELRRSVAEEEQKSITISTETTGKKVVSGRLGDMA